MGIKKISTVW